jgi:hypothetical protein
MKKFSNELKGFINNTQWTFAKTYAATWPHHYIVKERVDENLFLKMVKHIRCFGYEGPFYKQKYIYFDEDGLVYWTMGAPVEETTIINRCPKEETYECRLKKGTLP